MDILSVVVGLALGAVAVTIGGFVRSWYSDWKVRRDWAAAGRQWKYIVDYSTRAIELETVEEERERIEYARSLVNSYDLRTLPDDVDEGFSKTLEYLQDEENPNKISDVSELAEHRERLVEIEKRAAEIKQREEELDARLAQPG